MQKHQYCGQVQLGNTKRITFFATNASDTPSTPSVGPTYIVYSPLGEAILTGSATNFASTTGLYRIPVECTETNGFEAGEEYLVVVSYTATVPKGEVYSFEVT